MEAKKKKPRGFGKFDKLMRVLIQVPRADLEATMAKRKIKRRKKS